MNQHNVRNEQFNTLYFALPSHVRLQAVAAFQRFLINPHHRSLRRHQLKKNHRGKHIDGSVSISIGMQYPALFVFDEQTDTNIWYWIGTHADYNHFTGVN